MASSQAVAQSICNCLRTGSGVAQAIASAASSGNAATVAQAIAEAASGGESVKKGSRRRCCCALTAAEQQHMSAAGQNHSDDLACEQQPSQGRALRPSFWSALFTHT